MASSSSENKFQLVHTSKAGRALLATADIGVSQLIFQDSSAVVAPITHTEDFKKCIFCVACFKLLKRVNRIEIDCSSGNL
jgi:hypothetical protein